MSSAGKEMDENLVLYANSFFLSIIGICAVLTIPRVVGRYSRRSEWRRGLILRRSIASNPSIQSVLFTAQVGPSSTTLQKEFREAEVSLLSARVPTWSSVLYPISSIFEYPLTPGYSGGQLVLLLGYLAIVLAVELWNWQSPFTNPIRTGLFTASQVPIVFVLATKNNIFGILLGIGYEKLNYVHRFGGRIAAVAANLHALHFFYQVPDAPGGLWIPLQDPLILNGLLALIGMNLLLIFSTEFWRQNHYNIFLYSHIVGFTMVLVCLSLHQPIATPFVLTAAGAYGLDHLLRLIKTKFSTATLLPIPELGLTRIEVHSINTGWRAGQHVRLRVISSGMGILGWSEVHPFTIAGVGEQGMVLMCKKAGGWTNRLFNFAHSGMSDENGIVGRTAHVVVEGPYGGVGHTLMDRFTGAILVVGGSGITFALAFMQEFLQKKVEEDSNLSLIHLVWSVQDPAALTPMLSQLSSFIQEAGHIDVKISVFYTRATSMDATSIKNSLPDNLTLNVGRPRVSNIIKAAINQICANSNHVQIPSGIAVGVCGPAGLGKNVRKVVSEVSSRQRNAVGGIELYQEMFGL